ncbi:MAG: 16S rRNA (guanine(527)-N(7))-methyltransferase RsmG [Terracidiphilus sp.]
MDAIPFPDRLSELLTAAGLPIAQLPQFKQFSDYLSLIIRWNARINLTSVRDPGAILSRHFVESIACAHALPAGIGTLLDYGSGAGFPGIPISICRSEIAVTLAESQGKKSAFLQEAIRVTGIDAKVYTGRAETLTGPFDCITLRAVDQMETAVRDATRLVGPGGRLAPLTTFFDLPRLQAAAGPAFSWSEPIPLPGSDNRILAFARRPESRAT